MKGLLILVVMAFGLPARGSSVSMRRQDGIYRVEGRFEVNAVSSIAWNVITDYDDIGRFVSSIQSSRVLRRDDDGVLVDQRVKPSFLFFSRRIHVTLAVREFPPGLVAFKQAGARPFDLYEGDWRIIPAGPGCVVKYELAIAPGSAGGPGFVVSRSLTKNVARQLDEVRAEIERRAGVAQTAQPREERP